MPLALRLPNSFETFECLVELLCSPSKLSSVPGLLTRTHKPWRGVAAPPPWPATKVAEAAKKQRGPAQLLRSTVGPRRRLRSVSPPRREEPKLKSVLAVAAVRRLVLRSPRGRALSRPPGVRVGSSSRVGLSA